MLPGQEDPVKPCPWCVDCEPSPATTSVIDESGDEVIVCRACARDFWEWMATEAYASEGYDGPHFADTMSGGCIYMGES